MGLTINEQTGFVVAKLEDQHLTGDDRILQISNELTELLGRTPSGSRLVLDFAAVETVASMLLGDLVNLNKRAVQKQVKLQFCNFRSDVLRILETSKLDHLFEILDAPPDSA